jgi:hypothetical protein
LYQLLHDKTCRQALLKRSTEAVATPDEAERLQLAVKSAGELANLLNKSRLGPSIYYGHSKPRATFGCSIPEDIKGQPSC